MTAPWARATCPKCERASDDATHNYTRLPHGLGVQHEVHHRHGYAQNEHIWRVTWLEETRVNA